MVGTNVITVANSTGLFVGQRISSQQGTNFDHSSRIEIIDGNSVTLSHSILDTVTADTTLTFSNQGKIGLVSLIGEALNYLELARRVTDSYGNIISYRCNSLLPIIDDPISHIRSKLIPSSGSPEVIPFVSTLISSILPNMVTVITDGIRLSLTSFFHVDFTYSPSCPLQINSSITLDAFDDDDGNPGLTTSLTANLCFNGNTICFSGSTLSVVAYLERIFENRGLTFPAIIPADQLQLDGSIASNGDVSVSLIVSDSGSASSATVHLYPSISGTNSLITFFASSGLSQVMPLLLDKIVQSLLDNSSTQTIGEIIGECSEAMGICTDTGTGGTTRYQFDGIAISNLIDNPSTFIQNNLSAFITKVVQNLNSDLSTSLTFTNGTNEASLSLSLDGGTSNKLELYWSKNLPIAIGLRFTTIDLVTFTLNSSSSTINLECDLDISIERDGTTWKVVGDVDIGLSGEICTFQSFPIHPRLLATIDGSTIQFMLATATYQNLSPSTKYTHSSIRSSTDCVYLSFDSSQAELLKFGYPDPSDLLTAAIIGIIDVVIDLTDVVSFLRQPLAANTSNQALKNLTTPGKILWALEFLNSPELGDPNGTFNANDDVPNFDFNADLLDSAIPKPWESSDPIRWVLNSAIVLSEIQTSDITLFESHGSFPFKIDLCQDTEGVVGLQLEPTGTLEIGGDKIAIEFYTQSEAEVSEWTPIDKQGLTVGVYNTSTSNIHLKLSLAGLGIRIRRRDRTPLLDSFLLLNSVGTQFAILYDAGDTTPSIDFGIRLDLDDFSISLGGDGEGNGGNKVAAGVLSDEGQGEPIRPVFDIAGWVWYDGSANYGFSLGGILEKWFTINKNFGPLKISQIGVRYLGPYNDAPYFDSDHRLVVLIDAETKIADFQAQVDDLSVSIPSLEFTDFSKWEFGLAGFAIAYSSPAFSIAGALRETNVTDTTGNFTKNIKDYAQSLLVAWRFLR